MRCEPDDCLHLGANASSLGRYSFNQEGDLAVLIAQNVFAADAVAGKPARRGCGSRCRGQLLAQRSVHQEEACTGVDAEIGT